MRVTTAAIAKAAKRLRGDWRLHVENLEQIGDTIEAKVKSFTDAGITYQVSLQKLGGHELEVQCQCDGIAGGNICTHIAAPFQLLIEGKKPEETTGENKDTDQPEEIEVEVMAPDEESAPDDPSEPDKSVAVAMPVQVEPGAYIAAPLPVPVMTGAAIKEREEEIQAIQDALTKDLDYGTVPGIKKPFLLQPGAEKLQLAFNVIAHHEVVEKEVDHDRVTPYKVETSKRLGAKPAKYDELKAAGTHYCRVYVDKDSGKKDFVYFERAIEEGESLGFYRYITRTTLIHREHGAVLGSAIASCCSLESKYIRNPRNVENTILQMSQKRSSVRATRTALGLSGRFTQDPDVVKAEEGGQS